MYQLPVALTQLLSANPFTHYLGPKQDHKARHWPHSNPLFLNARYKRDKFGRPAAAVEEPQGQVRTSKRVASLIQKKIKLYRKENEEFKHELTRQAQVDANLLLNSKELSEANSKHETAIHEISLKLEIELESAGSSTPNPYSKSSRPVSIIAIKNISITEETAEVDLPKEEIGDEDIIQLSQFKNIKSLVLGENRIGDAGIEAITGNLTEVIKLQLNSNCFSADSLKNIQNLGMLRVLDVRNNNLGDKCMPYLSTVQTLTELSISKNSISDKGLEAIQNLTNLVYLDLTTNLITDEGATYLLGFKKLTHLYIMSNRIS